MGWSYQENMALVGIMAYGMAILLEKQKKAVLLEFYGLDSSPLSLILAIICRKVDSRVVNIPPGRSVNHPTPLYTIHHLHIFYYYVTAFLTEQV
jgi:hypothetical protein